MEKEKKPSIDHVFQEKIKKASDFTFSVKVAKVFDDMVERSVPFYTEIQRMIIELANEHALPHTNVIDLGCSTGTTLLGMHAYLDESIKFIGIDDSREMLNKCESKIQQIDFQRDYELIQADIGESQIQNASVVILSLTLQFIRPIHREKLIKKIYEGLVKGGVLIAVEKILAEDSFFNRNFIRYYYDYKRRNNYSEMEIAQKREALENILIPYKLSENHLLLRQSGFSNIETFFKWYNFSGFIAVKN